MNGITIWHIRYKVLDLKGIAISKNSQKINHLLFADDSFFFIHLNKKSLTAFSTILKSYCAESGQVINFKKSIVTFSPFTPITSKEEVAKSLSISESDLFGKYLGIELDMGTNRKLIFQAIIDKVKKRILSWSAKFLSFAG